MNEIAAKIKTFVKANYKIILVIGGIILVCLFIGALSGGRKDVSSYGEPTDTAGDKFERVETAEQQVAGTAEAIENTSTDLAGTIEAATDTSTEFDAILDRCESIIEAIRSQPTR